MMKVKTICTGLMLFLASCSSTKHSAVSSASPSFDMEAHRGGRGLMPENTIPAMLNGIDLGATTLEMDLVISKDNKVVVSHDLSFNEQITTTPEGIYLSKKEAVQRLLYHMNYDSIRKYDVGLKPYPDFPRQKKIAVYKPLLSDLLDATEDYAKKKNRTIWYNIEIKSNPVNDGKAHPPIEQFVDLAMEVIKAKGIEKRCIIQSFDVRALQVMHKKYPEVPLSFLVSSKKSLQEELDTLGFIPAIYSPNGNMVNPELVSECHEKNIRVIPWTINKIDEIKKMKDMGIDGVITDYPDLFSQL